MGDQPASDILTTQEAAAYLRISVSQLYTLTRCSGQARQIRPIPTIRFGKSLKFRRSSLDKWLAELEKISDSCSLTVTELSLMRLEHPCLNLTKPHDKC